MGRVREARRRKQDEYAECDVGESSGHLCSHGEASLRRHADLGAENAEGFVTDEDRSILWQCPHLTVSGGLLGKLLMLAVGLGFVAASLVPGTRVRGAFSRQPGIPATRTHRILLFAMGALTTFEATKLLVLCA